MSYKNNELYEIIKPVKILNKPKLWYGNKKVLVGMIIGIIITCCLGIHSNYETLQRYIPSLEINRTLIPINSWDNYSIVPPILNLSLINPSIDPSFNAGGFKIGYN